MYLQTSHYMKLPDIQFQGRNEWKMNPRPKLFIILSSPQTSTVFDCDQGGFHAGLKPLGSARSIDILVELKPFYSIPHA